MIGLASMHDQGWSRRPTPETPKPQQSFSYWTGPILLSLLIRVAVTQIQALNRVAIQVSAYV